MLNIDLNAALQLSATDLIGESVACLGQKGSGKTNTAAVLIEELLDAGVPLAILDQEGEYWGLRERYGNLLIVGRSDHADLQIEPEQAGAVAELSLRQRTPVILDLSGYQPDAAMACALNFLTSLKAVNWDMRQPYQVVVEEAHDLIPERENSEVKQLLVYLAKRGRKRGFGLIVVSQRSASVSKDVLTQCGICFLHKVVHPTDISTYAELLPREKREVKEMVAKLRVGQALCYTNEQILRLEIRRRHTYHAGYTPGLDTMQAFQPQLIDMAMIEALQKALSASAPPGEADPVALRDEVKRLRTALNEKSVALKKAEERIAALVAATEVAAKRSEPLPLPAPTPEAAPPLGSVEYRSQMATKRAKAIQESRLGGILMSLRRAERFQRLALGQLILAAAPLSWEEMAVLTDRQISTLRGTSWRPLELAKLVAKTDAGLRSTVDEWLKRDCPDLDADRALERILNVCEVRLPQLA